MNIYPIIKRESNKFCENIKLSDIKYIQPHGCLLAIDNNFHVISYSDNLDLFFETKKQDVLSQSILLFLKSPEKSNDMEHWLRNENKVYRNLIWQSPTKEINVSTFIHQTQGLIILEFELINQYTNYSNETFSKEIRNPLNSIQDIVKSGCDYIKHISNYDRVMVYQFDFYMHDGLVIGEASSENMDSYLDYHFPADDIPKIVRDMYLINPIRYIPSILQKPIPIIHATQTISQNTLDISQTNLRGIVQMHMQYLINLKVVSSISVAIIIGGKLWGLIICHHKEPKYIYVELRHQLIKISKLLAEQISTRELARDHQEQQRAGELQAMLSKYFKNEVSLLNAVDLHHGKVMDLVTAIGMSVYFENKVECYGETPNEDEILALIVWLEKQNFSILRSSSIISFDLAFSLNYKDMACGLLAIKIEEPKKCYLLFYRPEHIYNITWAGNPDQLIKRNQESYSPRNSFNAYVETIKNHSLPWTNEDMQSAEFIRAIALNILNNPVRKWF